jgi:hypothetical protein
MQSIIFKDIIYETAEYSFGLGKYDTFEVVLIKENSYVNATKLCASGKREYRIWCRLERTKSLMKYYKSSHPSWNIIMSMRDLPNSVKGIYVHPKLVPHILMWISNEFSDKVSIIVDEWLMKDTYSEPILVPVDRDDLVVNELLETKNILLDTYNKVTQMNNKVTQISNKLEITCSMVNI